MDCDLFADGLAVEGRAFAGDLEALPGGTAGGDTVLLGLDQLEDLGAAFGVPGLGVADGFAVAEDEWVGQGVDADFGFVVVDGDAGDGLRVGRGRWGWGLG